jgi:hypothetical protein
MRTRVFVAVAVVGLCALLWWAWPSQTELPEAALSSSAPHPQRQGAGTPKRAGAR